MLGQYKEKLEAIGCFKDEYPEIIKVGMNTVGTNAPERMKAIMILTELTVFASNLRKPIMWQKKKIPVNMISFVVAGSGIGKDSSMQMIRTALEPAYLKINTYREAHAKVKAVEDAVTDGKKEKDWRKYYVPPRDLFGGIGTVEGQINHLAELEDGKLGAGYIQVSELGSELQSNKDVADNIKVLAIGYDNGYIPAKIVKDPTSQVRPVKNLPYNALMFGAPHNLIYDEAVKRKLIEEFSTKLSRRSHFYLYNADMGPMFFPGGVDESTKFRRARQEKSYKAMEQLEPYLTSLVEHTDRTPLTTSQEVEDAFGWYQEYNDWYAHTKMSNLHPMAKLHRQHLQWKALKVAGALAILDGTNELTVAHYVDAVNLGEIFAPFLEEFEIELAKEPYELFADHMNSIAEAGYANISAHKLRKLGYIKGTGSAENKLIELIKSAKSYDDVNRYEYSEGYIHFYEGTNQDTEERDELA